MMLKKSHELPLTEMSSHMFLLLAALTYYIIAKIILGLNQIRKNH